MEVDAEFEFTNAVYCTTLVGGCTLASGVYSPWYNSEDEHLAANVRCNAEKCKRALPDAVQCKTCEDIGTAIVTLSQIDPQRSLLQVPKP